MIVNRITKMELDTAINKAKGMGAFQKKLLFLTLIKEIYGSFHMIGLVFISLSPEVVDCQRRAIKQSTYYSIANEWNLICDKAYYTEMAQSIYMCGVLLGAPIFGPLSDWYGRRRVLFVTYLGEVVASCCSAFASSFYQFAMLRFVLGFFCQGVVLTSFTLLMEVVGAEHRAWCGIFVQVCFAVGIPVMSGIAYLVHDWETLTLIYGLFGLLAVPFYRSVVESPRWLLAQGKVEEAELTMRKMARHNGVDESDVEKLTLKNVEKAKVPAGGDGEPENLLTVMRHPRLRIWTLLTFLSWAVNSGVYYGLTLMSGKLGNSRHLSVALSGLVELPSNFITPFLMRRLGRRPTLCLFMYGAGICCFIIVFLSQNVPVVLLALATVGKLCITGSFSTAYVYTSEIYPTSVRSASLGLASTAARIGGILAPFILLLGGGGSRLPFIVFAAIAIFSASLNWHLPETNKKPMLQTVSDCANVS